MSLFSRAVNLLECSLTKVPSLPPSALARSRTGNQAVLRSSRLCQAIPCFTAGLSTACHPAALAPSSAPVHGASLHGKPLLGTTTTKLAPPTNSHAIRPPCPSSFSSAALPSHTLRFTSSPSHHSVSLSSHHPRPAASTVNRAALLTRHFSSSIHCPSPQSDLTMSAGKPSEYTVRKVGQPNTLDYRAYIEKDGVPVSPFHDIPLYANEQKTILNMVVEIPRWTNAKLEICKEEFLNPIKQDVKKGKLRYVRNCFPHKGYLWNYGAFPRTWEDPNVVHPETKAKGDNDPLDVCEVGELVGYTGQVKQVKVLGVMALLDEEETDWKVIVIDVNDPLANKLHDIEDVERHLPGLMRATNEWFRIYKIPDGKPENQFAFSGECKNKKYAMEIVHECADAWDRLMAGKSQRGGMSIANTTIEGSPDRVDASKIESIPAGQDLAPAPIEGSVDKWFFISGAAV
ncbi:inorganic pyrophosphatase [Coccidioides immitis H538.4]|nr:inorganic pyrophosphatase [Coccidioides immitis RMSCC 2394]KMU76566.1 inorganic pyrophosphatase [Coccidioides immitis RMSCC 3703]KMU89826.1 inorganic pyrophosphatase [Coccidioides immitis H538.4]